MIIDAVSCIVIIVIHNLPTYNVTHTNEQHTNSNFKILTNTNAQHINNDLKYLPILTHNTLITI